MTEKVGRVGIKYIYRAHTFYITTIFLDFCDINGSFVKKTNSQKKIGRTSKFLKCL